MAESLSFFPNNMKEEMFTVYGNSEIAKGDENAMLAFYAIIGFFIEVAQMLEYNLRKLLCYEQSVKEIESGELTKERVTEICDKYDKYYDDTYADRLTLGMLVNRIKKDSSLLNDFVSKLTEVNQYRVKIVHSIFQININTLNLADPNTVRDYTDKRLIPMTNMTIEINRAIINIIGEYRKDLHEYKSKVGLPIPQ